MKRFDLFRGVFLGVVIAGCLFASGCSRQPKTEAELDQPSDLILDLGNGIKMRFAYVEPLKLYVEKFEVSNGLFRRFSTEHNSGTHQGLDLNQDNQPAVNVSWNDAQKFCDGLNENFGVSGGRQFTFRLPTEEEWEAYATGGEERVYPWGNHWPPPKNWNYYGVENPEVGPKLMQSAKVFHNDGYRVACPVLASGTNAYGLFGIGGNVWEWCADVHDDGKTRAARGASWADYADLFLKVSREKTYAPDYKYVNLGFRVVAEMRDVTREEKQQFADAQQKKAAQAQAELAKKQAEETRKAAEAQAQTDQAKQEKRAASQAAIRKLVEEQQLNQVSGQVSQYEKDFGPDDFSAKWRAAVTNTLALDLADNVMMEFVRLPSLNIWAGKYEVTNREFKRFKPEHDSGKFKETALNGDNQPVVNVSWTDARDFCQWLNARAADRLEAGTECRLPTEAEWEALAACGKTRVFPWGDQWPPVFGNYGAIEDYDDGAPVTCPVAESGKNEWELYGIGGNVWEWCAGWFDAEKKMRPIRGGAWNLTQPDALKIVNRNGDAPDQRNSFTGFRVVVGPKLSPSE